MGVESQLVLAASPLLFSFLRPCTLVCIRDLFTYTYVRGGPRRERSFRYAFVQPEFFVSESFQSSSSQNCRTRPKHRLVNSGRETRQNVSSLKSFS